MTEPNTSTNNTSCISGCRVEKTTSPVLRIVLRRFRPATSPMSRRMRVSGSAARSVAVATSSGAVIVAMSAPRPQATTRLGPLDAGLLGDVAGETQEDVVEGRAAQPHVRDRDLLGVERADGGHERVGAGGHGSRDRAELAVDGDVGLRQPEGAGQRAHRLVDE